MYIGIIETDRGRRRVLVNDKYMSVNEQDKELSSINTAPKELQDIKEVLEDRGVIASPLKGVKL